MGSFNSLIDVAHFSNIDVGSLQLYSVGVIRLFKKLRMRSSWFCINYKQFLCNAVIFVINIDYLSGNMGSSHCFGNIICWITICE